MDEASRIFDITQVISQLRENQTIEYKGKKRRYLPGPRAYLRHPASKGSGDITAGNTAKQQPIYPAGTDCPCVGIDLFHIQAGRQPHTARDHRGALVAEGDHVLGEDARARAGAADGDAMSVADPKSQQGWAWAV